MKGHGELGFAWMKPKAIKVTPNSLISVDAFKRRILADLYFLASLSQASSCSWCVVKHLRHHTLDAKLLKAKYKQATTRRNLLTIFYDSYVKLYASLGFML